MGSPSGISGILLAAGSSSRFDGPVPKQLIEFEGVPLVRRAALLALASRLGELVVVTGYEAPQVVAALTGLDLRVVENPAYVDGQSSSIRCGLDALAADCVGALLLPCDQPWLTCDLLDRLIERFEATGGPIVEPVFQGRRGAPVLFARGLFSELAAITGDTGGRSILNRHRGEIVQVELAGDRELHDIDKAEDLRRLSS